MTPSNARDLTELRLLIKECLIPRIDRLEAENRLLRETVWPVVAVLQCSPHDENKTLSIEPWMDMLDDEELKRMESLRYQFQLENVPYMRSCWTERDTCVRLSTRPTRLTTPEEQAHSGNGNFPVLIDKPFEEVWTKITSGRETKRQKR